MLGRRLRHDTVASSHIQQFFTVRKRPMPERTRVQAEVPEGALVLNNPHGTAPGLAMEVNPNRFRPGGMASWVVMLPGPPRELRPCSTIRWCRCFGAFYRCPMPSPAARSGPPVWASLPCRNESLGRCKPT